MILCCGDALIDMIPSRTTTGREGFVPHAGGAVFNTAIALGRLGVQAGILTGLSTDIFGQMLADELTASHVDISPAIRSGRPSTLAFVRLSGGHASYTFYDENSAGRMITAADLPELSSDVTALYVGGIGLACEPCGDSYAALIERECESRVVMLDPNIRPGFIQDEQRFLARLTRMIGCTDILKVSDEDLNWILPDAQALEEKISTLCTLGPSMVVLTRGEDGATAFLADGRTVSVPIEKVEVVDTVGAGDTFNAGFLASLSEQGLLTASALASAKPSELKTALAFGARVASINVSRAGANPPWKEEI